jgi:drug/metabolite transporter (DMT)-like permease
VLGIAFAFLAALGWGVDAVLARQGLRQVAPALGTLISICATLPVIALLAVIVDPDGFRRLTPAALVWFAALGLLNFPIGRQLNFRATRHLGAARASAIFAASPLISVLLAGLLGEPLTIPLLAGVALIVLGVTLVVSSR